MDNNLNPGSDEKALLTLSQVVIGGISYRAAITSSHLILTDMDSGNRLGSIPLPSIGLATSASNRLREPIIRLSVHAPEGGEQEIELIFPHIAGGLHIRSRDVTTAILKAQGVPVTIDDSQETLPILTGKESMDAGIGMTDTGPADRTTVPDWTHLGVTRSTNNLPLEEPKPPSPIVTVVAVILIAAICITAMIVPLGPGEISNQTTQTTHKTTATASPSPTAVPVTTLVPVAITTTQILLQQGSVPGSNTTSTQYIIPQTGVWVRVSYPGNYTGYISSNGQWREINASGDQFYQLSMDHGIIDGMLEKGDGSVKTMAIEVYKDGTIIDRANTSAPLGTVVTHTRM